MMYIVESELIIEIGYQLVDISFEVFRTFFS